MLSVIVVSVDPSSDASGMGPKERIVIGAVVSDYPKNINLTPTYSGRKPYPADGRLANPTPLKLLWHSPQSTERTTLHLLPFVPPSLGFSPLLVIPFFEHPLPFLGE